MPRSSSLCDSLPETSDELQFTTATRHRFSNLSLKMNLYLEKLSSTSQDFTGAYLNDANWFVVRDNSCKLIVVFPFTRSPILHICSSPGFFLDYTFYINESNIHRGMHYYASRRNNLYVAIGADFQKILGGPTPPHILKCNLHHHSKKIFFNFQCDNNSNLNFCLCFMLIIM